MVFPDRIRSGLDVRTTVRRSLQIHDDWSLTITRSCCATSRTSSTSYVTLCLLSWFKLTRLQTALRELLNETSIGSYDFVYLRIDFQNNCNVGYAFINFADPTYIIDFVESVAGRRWNRFNSDKVAEVSYATIQGRDCLVQKFRNSSVMCEYPKFRPKVSQTPSVPLGPDSDVTQLFYAIGHPDVVAGRARLGDEEPFPAPDNQSKLRRSMDNAEHVGKSGCLPIAQLVTHPGL